MCAHSLFPLSCSSSSSSETCFCACGVQHTRPLVMKASWPIYRGEGLRVEQMRVAQTRGQIRGREKKKKERERGNPNNKKKKKLITSLRL